MEGDLSDNDIECIFEGPSSSSSATVRSRNASQSNVATCRTRSESSIVILDNSDPAIISFCHVNTVVEPGSHEEQVEEKWMQLEFLGSSSDPIPDAVYSDSDHDVSSSTNICDVAISLDPDIDLEGLCVENETTESNGEEAKVKSPKRKVVAQQDLLNCGESNMPKKRSYCDSPATLESKGAARKMPVSKKSSKTVSSNEEKEEATRRKEAKKIEKELLAAKKKEEKEVKEREKQAKKLQKEAGRLEKIAFKEARKPLQGGKSSLESLIACVPKLMLQSIGREEIISTLSEECDCFNLEEVDADSENVFVIRWLRNHVVAAVETNQCSVSMKRTEESLDEGDILIQIPKKEFIAMVDFHKQTLSGKPFDDTDRDSFNTFLYRYKKKYPEKVLHFFVSGMEGYFRKQLSDNIFGDAKPAKAKVPRRSLLDIPYRITYDDVEMAMIDVMCRFNVRIVQISSPKEFTRLLVTTHKAIADRVVKELKEQDMESFDAISANIKTKGVTVSDDNPESYRELWIRQLEQFSLVSRDIAITIANLYGSPRLLMEAYNNCTSEQEKEKLFENVMIKRGTDRRMGPKMSKLFYRFMNSTDGHELLE